MEVFSSDVLVVGGGGAGLRAAIAVAETHPRLRVAVISKVYPMRSHTVSAEGGAAAVIKAEDSLDAHAYDTISGGDWLCDQDAVEAFVQEAPEEMLRLEHWGCPWNREPDGHIAVRPFGGMKIERTWFAADKTGFHLLHTLFQTTLKYEAIQRYDEFFVTKLLVDEGRCQGVVAIELSTGQIRAITAKAVILCTGGCGKVFPFTTNANIKNGDGMALAYRAGAPLKDMEFGPRDRLSQCFVNEQEKGRTFEGPYGHYVHLDIRHLGEKLIDKKIPFVRELCLKYAGIDPVNEMIPVRPVVHYMMGGIHTDIHGATPLKGLYAAGEAACVSINGANRLGSNSLTEILVFGARAGKAAAAFAAAQPGASPSLVAQAHDEHQRLEERFLRKSGGSERIVTLRAEMHQIMEESAGIYRTETVLKEAAGKLKRLQERVQDLSLDDNSYTFNTELTAALELSYMLDVGQTIVQSALERRESRGSHQRTDYPQRDDERFLAHSLAHRVEDGSPRIEYRPVTITRWPPGQRVYGR